MSFGLVAPENVHYSANCRLPLTKLDAIVRNGRQYPRRGWLVRRTRHHIIKRFVFIFRTQIAFISSLHRCQPWREADNARSPGVIVCHLSCSLWQ